MAFKTKGPSAPSAPAAPETKMPENAPMELRVLLTNEEASVIIGRKGVNATRIRTETEIFLTILKTESPCPERLMVLKGQQPSLAAAILIIAQLLTDQAVHVDARPQAKPSQPDRPFVFRILVHKFLAGCIIGPGGAIVREIQANTQARISLSVEPLPNSTDKVCSVSGTPEAVSSAAARVMAQLAQNPLRPGCSVVPYVVNAYPNYYQPGFPLSGTFPQQLSFPSNSTMPFAAAAQYARNFSALNSASRMPGVTRTEKMVIPDACAGAVIGKGGSVIKEIKTQSGTTISLAEASQGGDRIVTITGSLQGIQVATFLIRQRVELQQQQQLQHQPAVTSKKQATDTIGQPK